eukprot:CAMPEP_0172686888 /NCGR_PEP_ID=MMETSP1074-20121228/21264_1 /TAXON_ID=2916 /ORGANISM="Ceratium fusus, Strain PA161109" /LENGTH=36 /DNA_ID= /DNA_START= /DNA_END= /DNA_ORIENTATION=
METSWPDGNDADPMRTCFARCWRVPKRAAFLAFGKG